MLDFTRDLRYAARILQKSPIFTATSIATLALCIGANTAVFSVVDAVLLRPLPYPEPDRLSAVVVTLRSAREQGTQTSHTGRTWQLLKERATTFEPAAYAGVNGVNFGTAGTAEYVRQQRVTAGFFHVLGISPIAGREFTDDEDRPGGPAVAIISTSLWKRIFNSDPAILGRTIDLRGRAYTVIGIMPTGLQTNEPADIWTPLRPTPTGEGAGSNYDILTRVKPGITVAQAKAELETIGQAAFHAMPYAKDYTATWSLMPLQSELTGEIRTPLLVLWGAVLAVLLIGCVNITGLLLARAASRTREVATRMALGSGRAAVMRQLFAESVLLAGAGGLAGVFLGYAGVAGLKLLIPAKLNVWQTIGLDGRVLIATIAVALLTSVLFGLFPAFDASRLDLRSALIEGGTRGVAGSHRRLPRRILIVAEVALGLVLLMAAGVLIRTFAYMRNLNPGFDASHVITASASLQDARYQTPEAMNRLYDETLSRIRALPGVDVAAVTLSLPYERALNDGFKNLDGPAASSSFHITDLLYVTPEYFRALRIPIHRGRAFSIGDGPNTTPVAIVNEAFVKKYLANQDAVGSHIQTGGARQIVGVVADVQQTSGWGDFGPLGTPPTIYIPATQTDAKFLEVVHNWFSPQWIVRTSASTEGIIAGMQNALHTVDPRLPFASFRSMADVQSRSMDEQRFQATLLGALAGLALLLAAVGIYGLIANSVTERTRELGIRMALGASRSQVMGAVITPGISLALGGIALGVPLALASARILRRLVFGVKATDPATFVSVGLVLLLVAAAASLFPALRLLRLNPSQTLRDE